MGHKVVVVVCVVIGDMGHKVVFVVVVVGVVIGDMGHKVGLNGLDNGWMRFNYYKIDRNNVI